MGDLREVRRLVAEVVEEAPSPAPAPPLYPLASSVDAASASAAAAALFPDGRLAVIVTPDLVLVPVLVVLVLALW